MPSPLFSQERAPTSVAYAELQSMFLDSLVGDAAWRCKYAISREGDRLPWALHEEEVRAKHAYPYPTLPLALPLPLSPTQVRAKHPYEVLTLRGMLAVPYFEKAP